MGKSNRWTEQDKALLIELYPKATKLVLLATFQRTEKEIRAKAATLGVKRDKSGPWMPRNWRPIGSERVDKYEGLLVRKVTDTGNPKADWKRVDLIDWEAVNGPVPAGYILMLKNPALPRTLDNLQLFTPSQHFQRISVHNLPPEVRGLCQLKGQISKEVRRIAQAATAA